MGKDTNRVFYLDCARVVAVFLVVYAHLFLHSSSVRLYIYAFHMPLFFIISGMLHKDKPVVTYIRNLLVPMAFFVLLFLVVSTPMYYLGLWDYTYQYGIMMPLTMPDIFISQCKILVIRLLFGGNFPNHYCWFLIVLFEVKLATTLARKFELRYGFIALMAVFLVLYAMVVYFKPQLFWIANSFMAFPFYYAGFKYREQINATLIKVRWSIILIAVCFIATVGLTMLNGRVSMMGCSFGKEFFPVNYALFYINGVVGSIMILLFSMLVKPYLMITRLSKALISILGFQGLFVPFLIGKVGILQGVVIAFVIIFLCYGLHCVMSRYLPFIYGNATVNHTLSK